MLFVFSRGFRIQFSPLGSFVICSGRKCFISVNANPDRQQKTKMSRTISKRGILNFFSIIICSSSSLRNSRLDWVCLNLIPENGLSVIHLFVSANVIIFFRFFKYLTVAFCAQLFSVLIKNSKLDMNSWSILQRGISFN